MRIRLIEDFNPVTNSSEYRIERLTVFPPMWFYVWSCRNDEKAAREVFARIKQTKAVKCVIRLLDRATI